MTHAEAGPSQEFLIFIQEHPLVFSNHPAETPHTPTPAGRGLLGITPPPPTMHHPLSINRAKTAHRIQGPGTDGKMRAAYTGCVIILKALWLARLPKLTPNGRLAADTAIGRWEGLGGSLTVRIDPYCDTGSPPRYVVGRSIRPLPDPPAYARFSEFGGTLVPIMPIFQSPIQATACSPH